MQFSFPLSVPKGAMRTERLYYTDSYLTQFPATVVAHGALGAYPAVALDRSAFYPEGGGQPADHGTLNGLAVHDVQVDDQGVVWHALAESAAKEQLPLNTIVAGRIDWARRFDHMQQHCGQHILTAAFIATCDLPTTAFHLSAGSVTIDLAAEHLSAAQVQAAEAAANQIIWANVPVLARFVSPADLAQIALRKPPSVHGDVRVVSVGDYDHSACGGTHPRTTGELGPIVVLGWSRQRGGTRVQFACGQRALAHWQALRDLTTQAARSLSVGPDALPTAVERLQTTNAALLRERDQLRTVQLQHLAQTLAQQAQRGIVCHQQDDLTSEQLRFVAQQAVAAGAQVAILAAANTRAHLVVACAPASSYAAAAILSTGLPFVAGRGGGKPDLAQGGGPQLDGLPAALAAMLQPL
jgi:alanyl-tRNA synthetase